MQFSVLSPDSYRDQFLVSLRPSAHTEQRRRTLRSLRLIFLLLLSVILIPAFSQSKKETPPKYWEELADTAKARYKSDKRLNPNALLYLDGKFIPLKDSITRKLLLDLSSNSEALLPVNFMVFMKIVSQHEAELDAWMGEFCTRMLYSHTDFLMKYLANQKVKKNNLYLRYAEYLAQLAPIEFQNLRNYLEFYYATGGKADVKAMADLLMKEANSKRGK
jgi:hypothetical protein